MLCVAKFVVLQLVGSGQFALDGGSFIIGLLAMLKAAGGLIFWVLILRAILSWVSQGRSPIEYVMIQLTEHWWHLSVASCHLWVVWI